MITNAYNYIVTKAKTKMYVLSLVDPNMVIFISICSVSIQKPIHI